MKDELESFLDLKESVASNLKEWVKDKSIPLEERWELFIKSGLGVYDSFYHNFPGIDWNKKTLYDDFYMEKHTTRDVIYFLDIIEGDDDIEWDNEKDIAFKEYFLEKFIVGFENDW